MPLTALSGPLAWTTLSAKMPGAVQLLLQVSFIPLVVSLRFELPFWGGKWHYWAGCLLLDCSKRPFSYGLADPVLVRPLKNSGQSGQSAGLLSESLPFQS